MAASFFSLNLSAVIVEPKAPFFPAAAVLISCCLAIENAVSVLNEPGPEFARQDVQQMRRGEFLCKPTWIAIIYFAKSFACA
jgi:hypothetical protein